MFRPNLGGRVDMRNIYNNKNPKMTYLVQRMDCFLKKVIFTIVLDMAYPRLILHHKVTLFIFRPLPATSNELQGIQGK